MPYINVNDAYILDNTGKQVDDAVDYALYNSNRNLLDNPWFLTGATINQRNASGTIRTNAQYFYDRWSKSGTSGSTVIQSNGALSPTGGGGFRQYVPWSKIKEGSLYTVSAMTDDGNVYSASGTLSTSGSGWQISKHLITNELWVGAQNIGDKLDIIFTGQGGNAKVKAVKLELGSYSTLANDAPPDYGTELAKCQRYFVRIKTMGTYQYAPIGIGAYTNSTTIRMGIFTPVPMRAVPSTLSVSGTLYVVGGGSEYLVNNIGVIDATLNTVLANVVVSSAPAAHHTYTMLSTTGSYIDISADLL